VTKRTKAKQATARKLPAVQAKSLFEKSLFELFDGFGPDLSVKPRPQWMHLHGELRPGGEAIPPDLDSAMFNLATYFIAVLENPNPTATEIDPEELFLGHNERESIERYAVHRALNNAGRAGFVLAMLRYADELKDIPEVAAFLGSRRENGEILAVEGRAAKAENDKRRAAIVCKMYRSVRPAHPPGRKGNGEACRVVADRYEAQERESIDPKTVRETAQKAGIADPPRRERKD